MGGANILQLTHPALVGGKLQGEDETHFLTWRKRVRVGGEKRENHCDKVLCLSKTSQSEEHAVSNAEFLSSCKIACIALQNLEDMAVTFGNHADDRKNGASGHQEDKKVGKEAGSARKSNRTPSYCYFTGETKLKTNNACHFYITTITFGLGLPGLESLLQANNTCQDDLTASQISPKAEEPIEFSLAYISREVKNTAWVEESSCGGKPKGKVMQCASLQKVNSDAGKADDEISEEEHKKNMVCIWNFK
ncbi:hypothetical protein Anapl_05189 [Anas platyrhynchos]|uniref:Uncharacterized protein n=1 Tax=Anas platyrhynchos TaxID=8839 RepID=R0JYU8_ANAPL|nr:hypothetical protein Anapl_05189 [Anas platyrhynchos]